MRRSWLLIAAVGVVGCNSGETLRPQPGDLLTPTILVATEWQSDSAGMISLQFRLTGNGRAEPVVLPGEQLPAGSQIVATMQFFTVSGEPVGTVLRPEFEADC